MNRGWRGEAGRVMSKGPSEAGRNQTGPVDVVRSGYNRAAGRYAASRDRFDSLSHLERFTELLPPPATVLDVGCGCGVPVAQFLVERGYEVGGIDISPRQVDLARKLVPGASFEVQNMLDLKEGEYSVDGMVSFYAVFHTPREGHGELLRRFASWIRPGGVLLITMGAAKWEGTEADFHGVEMYWSHFGADTNRELVESAGFHVHTAEIDARNDEAHQVILATRADSP